MTVNLGLGNIMLNLGLGGHKNDGKHGGDRDFDDRGGNRGEGGRGNNGGINLGVGVGNGGLGVNAGVGGLNVNLNIGASLGAVAIDAGFNRPNDEGHDADAIARMKRQSEGADLSSGRDSRGATPSSQDAFGSRGAAGAGQFSQGVGQAAAAAGFAPAARAGQAPVATGAIDRLVTALTDRNGGAAQQTGRGQGGGGDALASPQQAQNRATQPTATTVALAPAADPANQQRIRADIALQPNQVQQTPVADLGRQTAPNAIPANATPAANGVAPVAQAHTQGPAAPNGIAAPPATATGGPAQTPPAAATGATQSGVPAQQPATAAVHQTGASPQAGAPMQTTAAAAPIGAQPSAPAGPPLTPASATPATSAPVPAPMGPEAFAATGAPSPATSTAGGVPLAGLAPGAAPQTSPFAPVEAVAPVAPRVTGEAMVARQVAAVEQTERTSGSVAAVRDLNARLRDMPSASASQTLSELQPVLVRAAQSFTSQRVERVEGVLDTSPRSAMARAGADLAAAIDAGSSEKSGHVTEAVAKAIATGEKSSAERVIAFGEAVAFGAGLALPFAIIGQLEEKGEHAAARSLEVALAGGLARLLRRLNEAVDTLGKAAGPVAFEWSAWRASGLSGRELERRLRARLALKDGLTTEIDDALEAVEAIGGEMARALERLSRWNARTPEIVGAWRDATASRKTAFAIAQSLGAQHMVAQELAPGLRLDPPGRPDAFTFDAARELYMRFGFDQQGSAELAEISLARNVAVQMAGGWPRARSRRDPSDEAAFARIVAFLKGDRAPSNRHIETVTFADLDPEGERTLTLVGAPLLGRYELMDAA